jgi:uncharacterized protein YxjI
LQGFGVFKTWKGYAYCNGSTDGFEEDEATKPWFSVQEAHRILKKKGQDEMAVVTIRIDGKVYKIDGGVPHKSGFRISDADGKVMAEMKRKQAMSEVVLGEDVLTLTVGPAEDLLLAVGLVVVCGLLSRSI